MTDRVVDELHRGIEGRIRKLSSTKMEQLVEHVGLESKETNLVMSRINRFWVTLPY